jgi:futalosine hydrolase
MDILIVSATLFEIDPLITSFHFEKEINQNLKRYSFNTHQIDVLISGIGMTSTAFWMGKTVSSKKYDLAINLGIAGSFDDTIKIGETVHVIADEISELGAEDDTQFLSLKELKVADVESRFNNSIPIDNLIISSLKQVKGITVNTVHGNEHSILKAKKRFNPKVESMEGAAFLMACLSEKMKCLQIRTISNQVEKRNKDNWNIPLAINNLCKTGLKLLNSL